MQAVSAFLGGLTFGIGLILAGMTDPGKVQGFLDSAGQWDPSLALVKGAAVLVGLIAFPFATRRERTLLGDIMRLPTATQLDRRLVFGSLAFDAGWGLAGFCPGPALAALATGRYEVLLFTGAMLAGMGIFEIIERKGRSGATQAA